MYNGIVIDGEFADWDAVKKYDAVCPNDAHNECIEILKENIEKIRTRFNSVLYQTVLE